MATRSVTRQIGPLAMRAAFAPATMNAEQRTAEMTWTTGARVKRTPWFDDPYYEELSTDPTHVRMSRLQNGAPLLDSHRAYSTDDVIGVVQGASLEGNRGKATVRFDKGEAGSEVMRKVGDGIVTGVSVGYRVHKMQRMPDAEDGNRVYRAVDWEPYELTVAPMGADDGTGFRSATSGETNPCVIEERTMDPVIPTVTTPAHPVPPPAPAAAPAAVVVPVASPDHVRAAVLADRERVRRLQQIGQTFGRTAADVAAAVDGGISIEVFTVASIDARAAATPEAGGVISFHRQDPRIEAGRDSREKWEQGATAWIIERSGLGQLFAEARAMASTPRYASARWARVFETIDLDPGEFRGDRMIDLAKRALVRSGDTSSGLMAMEIVGRAFMTRSPTQGTGDFPLLLENVLYKVLLAQYMVTPDTWTLFCRTGSVQDFRASKRYRMGTFGSLSALNELGEFANKAIPDAERQSLTASTKGNIIGISRQAIINDDMGAFSSLATMLGRAAKLSIEVDVYALLAANAGLGPLMSDGLTLFHATHNNIGTGSALGSAAIDADRVVMAVQRDPSGNEVLALTPAILVLPVGLGGTARQINAGQYDFDALTVAGAARSTYAIANRVGGLFRTIVDTPRITGTRRYLFADPAVAPTIEVAFVDGQPQPFMDIQQGWRVDGVEWKVREDYGVAAVDFRGGVTNAGV